MKVQTRQVTWALGLEPGRITEGLLFNKFRSSSLILESGRS
jgi:hypothetical protein